MIFLDIYFFCNFSNGNAASADAFSLLTTGPARALRYRRLRLHGGGLNRFYHRPIILASDKENIPEQQLHRKWTPAISSDVWRLAPNSTGGASSRTPQNFRFSLSFFFYFLMISWP